jgi:solute carrier family 25 protein 16
MLLSGGTAGLLAQTLTYPIDIVRRRMQVEALQQPLGRAPPRSSMRAHAAAILKDNGIRGLFRGLSINYLKVVPSTAVGFTIYDLVKQALQLENHL